MMWTDSLIRPLRRSPAADDNSPASVSFASELADRISAIEPLVLVWWFFALSTLCSSITRFIAEPSGAMYYALVVAGSGGCAWFWFLTRSLFRNNEDLGPGVFSVVPVVMAIEASAALMSPVGTDGFALEARRVFVNAAAMVCIASLVFVWREAFHGYQEACSVAERRFRIIYMGGFSLLVGITILWLSGASADSFAAEWKAVLLTGCAIVTLVASRIAVQYRRQNPREGASRCTSARPAPTDDEASAQLAQRILEAVKDETLLTTPNLKVAEFAERIGEQEYKVTRSITNNLQYRNFNHFLNSHRIERAQCMFNDPANHPLSIATIAYECGFNSLGPFNRAFKQFTGMTPREFRHR